MAHSESAQAKRASGMKRILLIMNQPPGCVGVQALIYTKQLPFYERYGWEVHFAGPAPWLSSILTEQLAYPSERLHYTCTISPSLRCSIRKNRHRKRSLPHLFFGCCQLIARIVERALGHDSTAYLLRGLEKTVRAAERRWYFDLIAGKSPDFKVLMLAHHVCQNLGKPFLALVDDPYGARDEQGFYPKTPELQQAIFRDARGALFMSPLTRDRYVDAGLLEEKKAYFITDSYPVASDLYTAGRSALAKGPLPPATTPVLQLIYLGMLPEWRPIEPLLEALTGLAPAEGSRVPGLRLSIYGFVYASARQRIASEPRLSEMIQIHPLVPYAASHWLAEDADVQLVVIGPRHLDNVPSKFFDYLAHHKPMLILGPPENPLRQIVSDLNIGLYVDGRDAEAIASALATLQANASAYQEAYKRNAAAIEAFSAPHVAERLCGIWDAVLRA